MSRYGTPLCVVIGPTDREARAYMTRGLDLEQTFGMDIRIVTRPQQLDGLRFAHAIFTPRAHLNPHFLHIVDRVHMEHVRTGATYTNGAQ
jgi:hypothetical protein